MWVLAVVAGVFVVGSAMLTGAHAAASQLGSSRIRTLLEEGFGGAEALAETREREASVRVAVRLITKTLDLAALCLPAIMASALWGSMGAVAVAVVSGLVAVLLIGDVLAHAVAARSPVRIALTSAPALLRVARWTSAITAPVARLEERILGENGEALTSEQRELRELREIQELGQEEGVLEEGENLLVERAFHLDELTAWDVMVPRVDVFAWKDDLTLEDIVEGLPDVPYSRVPVYSESVDDVTGILYIREAYERVARGDRTVLLRELARPPFFVPGSLSLARLLQEFQTRRSHMGIVADEFGGTDGLVTLEDVLEELVGEIHDETDVESEELVRISPVTVEVGAGIDLRDIDEALDVTMPKAEHRSLNGFILEELGHVPTTGDSFERERVLIEILDATETQVVKARLTKLDEEKTEEEEGGED